MMAVKTGDKMYYSRLFSIMGAGLGMIGYLLLTGGFAEAWIVQLGAPPGNSYPVVISAPGSYELIANLEPVAVQDAIDIKADNVTLNLNGFSIIGASGRGTAISSSNNNIVVSNGAVLNISGGIDLGDNCGVRNVRVLGVALTRGSVGSIICGIHSAIEDVLVDNGGIVVGAGSRIKNSTLVGGIQAPALTCPSGCLANGDIFEQGAVQLGSSGLADSFLGAGAFTVGGVNSD
jgi:hypothetical protein